MVGYGHVVFYADANALPARINGGLALRHRQPITHVEAWLHGEHHARLQLHGVFAEPVGTHVVDIQPQPVAGAVHVQVPVGPLFDQSVHFAHQQAQLPQTLHQHPHRCAMHPLGGLARPHRRHRRLLGGQHQFVEGPLFATEATVDRKGAGDVAVVVVVQAAAGIDQQQLAGI